MLRNQMVEGRYLQKHIQPTKTTAGHSFQGFYSLLSREPFLTTMGKIRNRRKNRTHSILSPLFVFSLYAHSLTSKYNSFNETKARFITGSLSPMKIS